MIRLIVNADDYGYYRCVSEGILDCHRDGLVTATGLMANGADFDERVRRLHEHPHLDIGVHLNLTHGAPLTTGMLRLLSPWHGCFPDKFALVAAIARRRITQGAIEHEWDAQIARCRDSGLHLWFLNTHEHIHMFPPLLGLIRRLAERHGIHHVRWSGPEWRGSHGWMRNLLLTGLTLGRLRPGVPRLLGMASSGRLTLDYLRQVLPTLRHGATYELMCHPGRHDPHEVHDSRLLHYHDWQGEWRTLRDPELRRLCRSLNIVPAGYRDLHGAHHRTLHAS